MPDYYHCNIPLTVLQIVLEKLFQRRIWRDQGSFIVGFGQNPLHCVNMALDRLWDFQLCFRQICRLAALFAKSSALPFTMLEIAISAFGTV